MATLFKRTDKTGAVSWQVKIRKRGHQPVTATFPRKTDAERWAKTTEAAILEGRYFATTEAKRHTISDLLDRYVRDVLPTKKAKTQAPQVQQLAWWNKRIGSITLADCTPALLVECRDALSQEPIPPQAPGAPERHRTPATVNRYLAVLSHAFTVAVKDWAWVDSNPLLKVTKPKEPRGVVRFLDPDERARLLHACRTSGNLDLTLAVLLSLATGARQAEVMGLRWGQVDFGQRRIILHETKNGERRVLSLSGPALDLLRERSKVRRLDTDLVFPGRIHPGTPVDLRTPWLTVLKRAAIPEFRWHDLRHSFASELAMSGASLPEIAAAMGHKTLNMVQRYAHLSEDHTASVVERMNARIFGEGGQ
ncbi:MAG: tyrosine-type recombinase/integrase [Lamprocystis purpurea]|jgi:integrase|uniref:tyrosine-type recombinase/integrase n=1 Tax=Lamprocystis purpurea TaxID=61598 RepID=UPI000371C1D6|nr:site-specific integrase [Lamprocystis purpurea]MBV5275384.1 tyrosine-type recombinase/integrase [Lamprocystis purpurea]